MTSKGRLERLNRITLWRVPHAHICKAETLGFYSAALVVAGLSAQGVDLDTCLQSRIVVLN